MFTSSVDFYPNSSTHNAVDSDQSHEQVAEDFSNLQSGVDHNTTQTGTELSTLGDGIERTTAEVKEQLGELETAVEKIPSPDAPPKTTLQLQGRVDVEDAWQSYLTYFLDPDATHGLGTDGLVRFLRGLDEVADTDVPTRVSEDVEVEDEVGSPNNNIPDIVIEEPHEFFICCELKLYSSEGENQTQRYIEDNYIGNTLKEQFPDHSHHYVYIRRPDTPTAEADGFVNITWREVREWFNSLLIKNQGRYPTRTTAQLADFLDTIHQDMTEDEHIQTAQEKMQLYLNHQDAIREAREGLDTVYEHEKQNWRRRFIEGYLPENWGNDWHTNPTKYGQIYHSKWRQDDGLLKDDTEIRLHFVHLIRNKDSFTDGKLTFQLRMPNGGEYRDRFEDLFMSERFTDELDPLLGKYDIDKGPGIDYGNPRLTGKTYCVVQSELPESYYDTLQQAVREHIDVAPVLNEILNAAIEAVENES